MLCRKILQNIRILSEKELNQKLQSSLRINEREKLRD